MQTEEPSITKKNFWDRNAARYDCFMRKNAIAYDQLYALLRPAVWHKAVLEGVDFPSGNKQLSLQLYKYYVDWASKNHIEYMTLDAGWSEDYIKELCSYAKEKNVKIIVWTWASCARENPSDWIAKMHSYGVSGAKIDFFERNDQIAMRWGKEFAERLAEKQMVAIFHGCPVLPDCIARIPIY